MPYPGQPKDTPIPPELDRWNWGAFWLNWIWGIGNSTYIALLMFVPFVGIVMIFVLGAKGSKWAWKNRLWENEEHFIRTQRKWARFGLVVIVGLALLIGSIFYGILYLVKGSDAYKLTMQELRGDTQVVAALGEPIEAGWFITGNININGIEGAANFSIPVSGPKGNGTVISRSTKVAGEWRIFLLIVRIEGNPTPLVLINTNNLQIPNAARDT
ncbi:MAG: cytochrome c oxidase assembly factor Coa1 family protein [Rhizobiaceae bacterium]